MKPDEIKPKLEIFKEKLPIDRLRLEEECCHQASLYNDIGEFVAQLKKNARDAKDRVEFEKARLKKDIRKNPGNYGVVKVSNDSVDEACIVHEDYRNALSEYSELQYLYECGVVLQESAAQRKSGIRDAVSLYTHEYYSSTHDMISSKKVLNEVTEDKVLNHRNQNRAALASQELRAESVSEEIHEEDKL